MSISALTWRQTPMMVFPSGFTNPSAKLEALDLLFTTHCIHWETSVLDADVTKQYWEFKPVAGAPASIANFRGMVVNDASAATNPTSGIISPHAVNIDAGQMFMTYGPDVGLQYDTAPRSSGDDNDWKIGNPYINYSAPAGGDTRYGGYAHMIGAPWGDSMYAIECEEAVCVVTHDRASQQSTFWLMGAIYQAPTNALGDHNRGDQAFYGMMTSGRFSYNGTYAYFNVQEGSGDGIPTFWPTHFMDATSQKYQPAGFMMHPQSDTRVFVNRLWGAERSTTEDSSGQANTGYQKAFFEHRDGSFIRLPISIRTRNSYRYGQVRQIMRGSGWNSHQQRADATATLKDIILGYRTTYDDSDVLVFINDLNPV